MLSPHLNGRDETWCPAALPRPIMAQAHDELPKCPSLDTVWRCCPVQEIQVFDPQDAP